MRKTAEVMSGLGHYREKSRCNKLLPMGIQSKDNWNILDPNAGLKLDDIQSMADRAHSLFARSTQNIAVKEAIVTINGVIRMISGLEYHYRISQEIAQAASQREDRDFQFDYSYEHEITAYINRAGQLYYFFNSTLVRQYLGEVTTLMPKLMSLLPFRLKNTAHRSVDAPRGETEEESAYHAMALNIAVWEPKNKNDQVVIDKYPYNFWKTHIPTFQIYTNKGSEFFCINRDHCLLLDEVYLQFRNLCEHS